MRERSARISTVRNVIEILNTCDEPITIFQIQRIRLMSWNGIKSSLEFLEELNIVKGTRIANRTFWEFNNTKKEVSE